MAMRKWMSGTALAVGAVALAGCTALDAGPGSGREGQPDEEAEENPPDRDEMEVIIPDTTRVMAPEARAALLSYDAESGTLIFGWDSAGIAPSSAHHFADPTELRVGDVVVSEPAPAAPYGVLRRVTDVIASADRIEVRTDKASIGDAVEQAKVDIQLPIAGGQAFTAVPGASFAVEEPSREERAVIGVGYEASLQWVLPTGFDFFTNGRCRLTQPNVVTLNALATLGLEIIGFNVTQYGVFGRASANLKLNIACLQNVVNHNFTIGSYVSPVYVTYIGGAVPLVFQFGIAAVGGIKQDSNDITLNAEWAESYEAGLGWRAGNGWGPWTAHGMTPFSFSATGTGTLRVRSGPVFALSLFAGDVFTVFNWVDIGFGIGATGAVYALPFLDLTRRTDFENGTSRATLSAGMESGGRAGGFIELWVGILGWPLFGTVAGWMVDRVFPEINYVIASF